MKSGIVTGKEYIELIEHMKKGAYALPAVNVTGTETANAALQAAADNKADIIIQVSSGGAAFIAGNYLDVTKKTRALGAISLARHVHLMAKYYGVCVVLHTDHANKGLIPWVYEMIKLSQERCNDGKGPFFSSHMLDLSAEPLSYNIAESKKILPILSKLGMSLEIEVGITGGEEDGIGEEFDSSQDSSRLYTDVKDVLKIYDELKGLGFYTVAVSFGNVHGVYKPGNVKLRPSILLDVQKAVHEQYNTKDSKPINLVFHGSSGSKNEQIKEALTYGVVKLNIDTDTQFAFSKAAYDKMSATPKAFKFQVDPQNGTPFKKFYDPRKWLSAAQDGLASRLAESFEVLGSKNKTIGE